MAEAKHTTHRWQATASGSAWQVRDATGRRVCSVSTIRVEQEEEARLIAAAPELLEALEELFADYKDLGESGDAGYWSLEGSPIGKKALAAMAKARGESSC